MKKVGIIVALAIASLGCSRREAGQNAVTTNARENEIPLRPLPTARPTIDPKSSRAAEELVQGFIRLLNARRFNDAYMLLGADAPSRSEFNRRLAGYSEVRASSGSAGPQEGAAGSIYVSVPILVLGKANGKEDRLRATAVLRRVNDVPGSTEAQRHWHIERIDWKSG